MVQADNAKIGDTVEEPYKGKILYFFGCPCRVYVLVGFLRLAGDLAIAVTETWPLGPVQINVCLSNYIYMKSQSESTGQFWRYQSVLFLIKNHAYQPFILSRSRLERRGVCC